MSIDRHADIEALLTDYVLGELDAAQRRDVEAHLPTCPACAEEVRQLNQAFHSIGLAEVPATLPPQLKDRVLARLTAEESAASDGRAGSNRRAGPNRLRQGSGGQEAPAYRAWLGVAAVMVLGLGTLLVLSMQKTARLDDAMRRADAVHERLSEQLAENDAQADLAVSILTAKDMRRIELAAGDAAQTAAGRAYFSPTRGLLIVADQLPEPPSGRVYQVWLIGSSAKSPVSAGLLTHPRSGRGMLIVPAVSGVAGETVTVAITDEPPGGLSAPTGGKHLVGSS